MMANFAPVLTRALNAHGCSLMKILGFCEFEKHVRDVVGDLIAEYVPIDPVSRHRFVNLCDVLDNRLINLINLVTELESPIEVAKSPSLAMAVLDVYTPRQTELHDRLRTARPSPNICCDSMYRVYRSVADAA
jgi:hypothetical protein